MASMQEALNNNYQGMTHTGRKPQGLQFAQDAMQGIQNAPGNILKWAQNNPVDAAFMAASTAPVVGDAIGFGKDVYDMSPMGDTPFTATNTALAGAGLLPFVPAGMGSIKKVVSDLPMDKASQITRARDWGDTGIDYYHASKQDIDKFVPGYDDGLTFLTDKPEFANKWLGKGKHKDRLGDVAERERSQLTDRNKALREKTMGYNELNKLDGVEFTKTYDERAKKFRDATPVTVDSIHGAVYPLKTNVKKIFDPRTDYKLVEDIIRKRSGDEVVDKGMHKSGNWIVYENKEVVDALKDMGYDAMRIAENVDGPHDTLAVFDPKNIRSKFAKFDPLKKNSANLLAGIGGATIIAPSMINALQGENRNP